MEGIDVLLSQFTAGGIAVWLIGRLKGWLGSIGIVEKIVSRIARVVAALVAALAVVGISFVFDPTAGVLTISGLTWAALGTGLWEWLRQYVIQQSMFRVNEAAKATKVISNGGNDAVPEKH